MSAHPHSVLVYSMGEVIGDGLIKLPFVAGLRAAFPDARISWCAAKGATVYTGPLARIVSGLIDEVALAPPGRGRAVFDLVIDTQQHVLRTADAFALGRRLVTGATGWRSVFGPDHWPQPVVGRLEALLRCAWPGASLKAVTLTDARALAAAETLLPAGPRYVGFAPGAGGADKRWPLDRYLALAERTAGQGATPVLFLGPDDADAVPRVRARLPTAMLPEWDRADPYDDVRGPLLVIALAARLSAAVANDAGPGHMFAAAGTPLLSLQRDRRKALKFRPAASRLEMLIAEDFGGDMDAIPVDEAWTALQRLLRSK